MLERLSREETRFVSGGDKACLNVVSGGLAVGPVGANVSVKVCRDLSAGKTSLDGSVTKSGISYSGSIPLDGKSNFGSAHARYDARTKATNAPSNSSRQSLDAGHTRFSWQK